MNKTQIIFVCFGNGGRQSDTRVHTVHRVTHSYTQFIGSHTLTHSSQGHTHVHTVHRVTHTYTQFIGRCKQPGQSQTDSGAGDLRVLTPYYSSLVCTLL